MLLPGALPAQRLRSYIGVELGYSGSDLGGSGAGNIHMRNGALTGVYFFTPLTQFLGAQPELLFTSRGGRTTVRVVSTGELADYNLDLTYIEVPILFRAFVPFPSGRTRLTLLGGMSPAFRIGCTVQLRTSSGEVRGPCVAQAGVSIRSFDYSVVAGGGISVRVGRSPVALEGRYTRGFREVISNTAPLLNRSYSVLLSVPF